MNSLINGKSSQYVTAYPFDSAVDKNGANIDTARAANYAKNTQIYGDGIRETSTGGTGKTSWHTDYSYFPAVGDPFAVAVFGTARLLVCSLSTAVLAVAVTPVGSVQCLSLSSTLKLFLKI